VFSCPTPSFPIPMPKSQISRSLSRCAALSRKLRRCTRPTWSARSSSASSRARGPSAERRQAARDKESGHWPQGHAPTEAYLPPLFETPPLPACSLSLCPNVPPLSPPVLQAICICIRMYPFTDRLPACGGASRAHAVDTSVHIHIACKHVGVGQVGVYAWMHLCIYISHASMWGCKWGYMHGYIRTGSCGVGCKARGPQAQPGPCPGPARASSTSGSCERRRASPCAGHPGRRSAHRQALCLMRRASGAPSSRKG